MNIRNYFLKIGFFAILFIGVSSLLHASSYEYSDAPDPYGIVKHTTGEWQRLGEKWNSETSARQDNLDTSDDGVVWSTDNGATWGNLSIYGGQEIIFGFDMTRAGYGIHAYDGLSAWVDWNADGFWSDNENIIDTKWYKDDTRIEDRTYWSYLAEHDALINPDAKLTNFFISESFLIPDDLMITELWLRARVACSSSINNAGGKITPYNTIHQGEVEDWRIGVNPVPEPATFVLLGVGLMGLAAAGRKGFQKHI